VTVHAGLYDNAITLDGSFLLKGSDLSLQATASAQLPQSLGKLFGNQSLLTGTADLEIHPGQDPTKSFVDVTVGIPNVGQAELKYDFAKHLHVDAHASLLGQSAELVGDVNPDGTFRLHGALNVSILGSTLAGSIDADNNGYHFNGTLNVLGQRAAVRGDVYGNGTYNLGGVIHINAGGVKFDADFTATTSGFHASGHFAALGATVYVTGDFWSDGRFALSGSARINVAGSWANASFNADNNGVHLGGSFQVLGQSVYVHGDFYANGTFNLTGSMQLNILGSPASLTLSVGSSGFHAAGWATVLGQRVYVHGDISGGAYSFGGTVWINVAGFGFTAGFTADNNGVHVNAAVNALGQTITVWGDVYSNGWFDFHGSIWLGVIGTRATVDVDPNGFHLDARVSVLGQSIEVKGDVYANGTFSLSAYTKHLWVTVDNKGLHWSLH
jgi:hypothetical protein